MLLTFLIFVSQINKVFPQEYFQQENNFKISVNLDDTKHEINAFESIEYINNSPDTLKFLFFHLWPNGYSDNNTGLAKQLLDQKGKEKLFKDPELMGFIDSLDFKVDGQRVDYYLLPDQPDICRIVLNRPVKSGDTILITTPFRVKIPKGVTSRLGHIGESYQISQWYPKPAVYDKSGWHQMPYLDQGEFYSEFGKYEVSITLPANYTVGATGELQTDTEKARLEIIAADTSWNDFSDNRGNGFPLSSEEFKTLSFTGNKIHDFAWFADKRFHVMKGSVMLPESGKMITTWVMFTNQQAELWKDALEYVNSAILYFSNLIGDFPYNTFTAVQSALTAGAGMEYPGLTVIGLADDPYSLDEVIAHEICHNWFYSALGSDERRFPFMDEGITSAYEVRYMNYRYPTKKLWEIYFQNRKMVDFLHIESMPVARIQEIEWLVPARQNLEQTLSLAAPDYSYMNYGVIIYSKAAIGFNYLRAFLGDSLFDSTMHKYYSTWASKHPGPDDLRNLFELNTGKNLSWFFSDFIGTTKHLDYKVVRLNNQQLLVKNRGEMISPLVISGMSGNTVIFKKWYDGFEGRQWIDIPEGDFSEIKIDPMHIMPELYRLNNNIRRSGTFRKEDPLRLQLLYTIEDPDKRPVMYIPAINWTRENGFMAGMIINNGFLLQKPVEYTVLPFYTIKNPGLAGYGKISFNITPYENLIRMAVINFEGTQFGAPDDQNYYKAKAGLDLYFRNIKMNNPVCQKIYGNYIAASDLFEIEIPAKATMRSYLQLGYSLEKLARINPYNLSVSFESGKSYQKTSVGFNYRYSYYGKDKGLDIGIFAGAMLKNWSAYPFYSLSPGGRSGREQYLFEGTYPDRFSVFPENFWSRQMTLSEGGLVSPVNQVLGYSDWLISISLTSNLPGKAGKMPVKPFINLLLNDHGPSTANNSQVFYEAGLKSGIWNLFEIYVPLIVSDNIESITGSFKERIRFVLMLDSFIQLRHKQAVLN